MPNTYAPMLTDSDTRLVMMRATADPNTDGNWANIDGNIDIRVAVKSMWAHQDSSDIHVATQDNDGTVRYHVFDPGTDKWTVRNEFVTEVGDPNFNSAPTFHAVSLALRADGDVVLIHAHNNASSNEDLQVFTRESGSWTDRGAASGAVDSQGVAVLGRHASNDAISWIMGGNVDATANLSARNINSSNVVSGITAGDPTVDTAEMFVCPGGTNTSSRGWGGYIDASDKISVRDVIHGDAFGNFTADVSDNTVKGHGRTTVPFVVACLALDGDDVHLLYADDVTQDIFHDNDVDGGGATDVEVKDGVTCNRLSANFYDRSGKKLAYLYLDGTTSKYAEVVIEQTITVNQITETNLAQIILPLQTVTLTALSQADLPDQNYYVGPFEI